MTKEQLIASARYVQVMIITHAGVEWQQLPEEMYKHIGGIPPLLQLKHAAWMCEEIIKWAVVDSHPNKCQRWLGFVQGIAWSHGIMSIEELKEINRPPSEVEEERPWSKGLHFDNVILDDLNLSSPESQPSVQANEDHPLPVTSEPQQHHSQSKNPEQ